MYKKDVKHEEQIKIQPRNGETVTVLRTEVYPPESYDGLRINEKGHLRYYFAHFLVIIFATGCCIGVNGMFAEIPLLVASAPEGAALPTYVCIMGSIGFMIPAIYAICIKFAPQLTVKNDVVWISVFFILATTVNGLQVFYHDKRTAINGVEYSVVMLILFLITGVTTGTRNVFLLPYLRSVGESFVNSFFIGEGLSGFIPSIVALIQGVGGNPICPNNSTNSTHLVRPPNFPPRDFFLFIASFVGLSTLAFSLMAYLNNGKFRTNHDAQFRYDRVSTGNQKTLTELSDHRSTKNIQETDNEIMEAGNPETTTPAVPPGQRISRSDRIYLYVMMFLVCFVGHGYLNNAEAYSSRPYGNSAHNLVVNLSQLASTTVYTLSFWMPPPRIRGITRVVVLVGVGSAYVSWIALSSPTPLWHDTTYGVVLLVSVWIVLMSFVARAKLAITSVFYQETDNNGLYAIGFLNLFGTTCGSTVSFFLFNYTTLFTPYTACEIIDDS